MKYPGLALVGGLGMAVAIAIGAGSFAFFYSGLYPTIPLDEGHRIVALENWDVKASNEERQSLHDFAEWRREMKSVQDVAAFRTVGRNLFTGQGAGEPVPVAEMTASGFSVARVAPLLGRPLLDEDEREGAPRVLVIGYEVWKTRFEGDPGIIGREVRVGTAQHTIVGVMPEGFAFPVNHRFWAPLRADPQDYARGQGPEIYVFGRLAPGATREQAQAELTTLGRRAAAAFPRTHERLRPQVLPYTYPLMDIQDVTLAEVGLMQLMVSLLLVVVCVNVSILVYARTATRQGEIAVRSALGASRRRIVSQLFAEALVLSAGAAVVGLLLAQVVLWQAAAIMEQEDAGTPFWTDYALDLPTVLYVVGLTLLAAVIVGVLPALQATGKRLEASLRQMGGGTGMRLGRTWTVLIVAQVAIAVSALPAAMGTGWKQIRHATTQPRYAADEYLAAWLSEDREIPADADREVWQREADARYGARLEELVRRLQAEPGVAGVTFASSTPGGEPGSTIRVDGVPAPAESPSGHAVQSTRVNAGYFDALGVPLLAGRPFGARDLVDSAGAVIVTRTFVEQVLGGGSALGRRIRYAPPAEDDEDAEVRPARWYEVVGVVEDLHVNAMDPELISPAVFHPLAPAQAYPAFLVVHVRGRAPADFAPRLREIMAAVDPMLKLSPTRSLDGIDRQEKEALRLVALVVGMVTLAVLLLSAAGIYALMSFTVTRRRREIGIRAALGADPGHLLRGVFSRSVRQLALGLGVGIGVAVLLEVLTQGGVMDGKGAVLLPAVAMLMLGVGMLAAIGPARRGLRIQPMDALRQE
ncbi:MAG TPA: ABC transporter permease [Longimicrobium sp.]|nr:ABC transporter permease [Longimicrobium sp.]